MMQKNVHYIKTIQERISDSGKIITSLLGSSIKRESELNKIYHIAKIITIALQKGHKIITLGNGGSACEAMHIVCELVGRCTIDRKSLPAVCLATNPATMTAIGNDYGFEDIFAHQVEGMVNKEDVVIGISTSGNSPNILSALSKANEKGALTVGYTGMYGARLDYLVNCCIKIPSENTLRIQEAHMVVTHIVCELVELMMFENKEGSDGR